MQSKSICQDELKPWSLARPFNVVHLGTWISEEIQAVFTGEFGDSGELLVSVDSEPEGTSTQDKSSLASLRTTLFSFPPFDKPERKILQSPVDYVEDEEDDGEDDEEGDVDEGVVALLPLAASQLPKLHLHQDGSVPEHAFFQIVFIFGF